MQTIHDILRQIRAKALSEKDKGAMFERLMQRWLMTDPRYSGMFTDVWLWDEFPYKGQFGYKDLGIDIVALSEDDEYWAVQCKCYDAEKTINKPMVDSFLATSGKTFVDNEGKAIAFEHRLWISTTNYWDDNAEVTIHNQEPPVNRVSLADLEISTVDWELLLKGKEGKDALQSGKQPMKHQLEAIAKAEELYKDHDRGKLIMACGTGKTFTSLKIVERIVGDIGLVLFMVPSIALLGQTVNEWCSDAAKPIKAICICSDPTASRTKKNKETEDYLDYSIVDTPLPASTNIDTIAKRLREYRDHCGLVVVFSTYQSVDVIAAAQKRIMQDTGGEYGVFDFIVCDEAHRTTGVKLSGADESNFTKIHSNENVQGKRRMYMTATPRLYGESAKVKASKNNLILCSMDDKKIYGEEFFRVNFSYAVQNGILTDYKVLVLTVSDDVIPDNIMEKVRSGETKEFNYDNATRMIGVINALSKKLMGDDGVTWATDPCLMRRAIAFTYKIGRPDEPGSSKNIAAAFPILSEMYDENLSEEERARAVHVSMRHVDGSMGALKRAEALQWLAADEGRDPRECRIISNVRCLSEGVDVPALDAVLFLSARNSPVDVVQSVGRVMRAFHKGQNDEKKYGYIIIPVVVPEGTRPEDALDNNEVYSVVWDILNALRSHDDNFNARVNTIALNKNRTNSKIVIAKPGFKPGEGGIGTTNSSDGEKARNISDDEVARQLALRFGDSQQAIYAKLVEKCGDRLYWENWAAEVGEIAKRYIARIEKLVKADEGKYNVYFNNFVNVLRHDLNPGVTDSQCIEMLAQHMITRPVFEALFKDYKFITNNSVSQSMQFMVDLLQTEGFDQDLATMNRFYDSVRVNVGTIDNLAGKQSVIKTLYEKFFKGAFPKTLEQMGTVYTPVECVDFIIHSVDDILKEEFGSSLTAPNVHILDPFTGTGTFITRLLQTGVIKKEDMVRKYQHEIHCNEILLLAYYVADINIEAVFQEICPQDQYLPFNGICLTDTFQIGERGDNDVFEKFFKENSEAVNEQRHTPIRVIIGNPPYRGSQKDGNDNAQNQHYEKLEERIADTYVQNSKSTNKNSLYNSYIKAYRWAADRIESKNGGVIAFIANGAWIDVDAQAGMRAGFEKDFDKIYVFDLRGNARTNGEARRKEGGGIFADGSRSHIAISILVKYPEGRHGKSKCEIYYHDIGDYLKREKKLEIIDKFHTYKKMEWTRITPNKKHDWIKQRGDLFDNLIILGDKKDKTNKQSFFELEYSCGLKTNRDAWCYNSGKEALADNIKGSIDYYNSEVDRIAQLAARDSSKKAKDFIDYAANPQKFSWDWAQKDRDLPQGKKYAFDSSSIVTALYRPFFKQHCYFNRQLNNRVYQLPQLFPTPQHKNLVICVSGIGVKKAFSCIMTDILPDLEVIGKSQCFPLYYYKKDEGLSLFSNNEGGWTQRSGITNWIWNEVRSRYNNPRNLTKEDIFYYVYGILHSSEYRSQFAYDLEKSLPRLPIVDDIADFMAFSKAGRDLADLHLHYDTAFDGIEKRVREDYGVTVECSSDAPVGEALYDFYKIGKMRFRTKNDKSTVIYNSKVTVCNIPADAYRYVVNGKSAVEWIIERYRVTQDQATLIVNDPNAWSHERRNPRYILDTLLSVIDLSIKTMRIVDSLPKLELHE